MPKLNRQMYSPGVSFFDMLMQEMTAPGGNTIPQRNEMVGAASQAEDQKLRGALGSRRKTRKGERAVPGFSTTTKFPGFEQQLFGAEAGFLPRGVSWRSLLDETEQERQQRVNQQREWAQGQRGMVGMGRY